MWPTYSLFFHQILVIEKFSGVFLTTKKPFSDRNDQPRNQGIHSNLCYKPLCPPCFWLPKSQLVFGCPYPGPCAKPTNRIKKHPHRSRPKKKSLRVGISRCYISINLGVRLEVIVTNLVSWHISPVSGTVLQPTYMDVSENRGTPESSLLIGFSIISHPFWGTPIFGNTHI